MLASALLDTGFNEMRNLVIGKVYSSSDLAFYNEGQLFPKAIMGNIASSINSVLLPAMSAEQDDVIRVRNMTRWAIKVGMYILAPLTIGLGFVAESFVLAILTDKWLPCVPFLRIFCFSYMLFPIHYTNLNAMEALGRSDLFLRLEICKKTVGVIALLLTFRISVMAMAYSLIITGIIATIINAWPNKKLLGYSYFDQLKDIFPYIIMAVIMGVLIMPLRHISDNHFVVLCLQVLIGGLFYLFMSVITKNDAFFYLYTSIQHKVKGGLRK